MMKLSAPRKTLMTALSRIQGIVEKSSIKPITSNALLCAEQDRLSVSATNLQIGMTAHYGEVSVHTEGTISVNARKMYELIKELPEQQITIAEKQNYWIEITCGEELNCNIIGLPPEDFPLQVEVDAAAAVAWNPAAFLEMIELCSFSICRDEAKINISGAFMEAIDGGQMRMVTTDGYRLSVIDQQIGDQVTTDGMIIPLKGVQEISRLLQEKSDAGPVTVSVVQNSLVIQAAEVELIVRLLDKRFPDYRVIIPGDGYTCERVVLPREQMRATLKRIAIFSNENNRPVVFSFKNQDLHIFTEDSELGNMREHILLGEPIAREFSFCINCAYLLDVVQAVEDDVCIEFNCDEENKPVVVLPATRAAVARYIIMPMIMD